MRHFDEVKLSISIIREMHNRWMMEIAADQYWSLMQFSDGSGFGDPDYFSSAVRASAEISRSGLYLMLFAQFEAEVNQRCEALIKKHKSNARWLDRRVWEALDEKNVGAIQFARRVSLLIDKGSTIYAAIQKLYQERNQIAHGAKLSLDIDAADAIETIEAAVAAMEENP